MCMRRTKRNVMKNKKKDNIKIQLQKIFLPNVCTYDRKRKFYFV